MEICRLCLLNHRNSMPIFSKRGPDENIAEIISKHVGEVSETDLLPKQICVDCWTKIENFHNFREKVHAAQALYLEELVKYEQESHFVEVMEPVHINVGDEHDEHCNDGWDSVDSETEPKMNRETDTSHGFEFKEIDDINTHSPEHAEILEEISFDMKSEDTDAADISNDKKKERKTVKRNEVHDYKKYSKKLICDICQATLSSKLRMKEHLMRHVQYQCNICFERCHSRKVLEAHNRTVHIEDAAEKCQKQLHFLQRITQEATSPREMHRLLSKHCARSCDHCYAKMEPELEYAQSHYSTKHGVDGYLKCCDVKMHTLDAVNDHMLSHIHPEHFKCTVCAKTGKSVKKFQAHISKHMSDLKNYRFPCVYCNKKHSKKHLLDVHYKYYHEIDESRSNTEEKKHTLADFFSMRCDLCETHFTSFYLAKEHYGAAHGIPGYLTCCGKKFIKAKSVDDHFKWHINPEYFKCKICGKCYEENLKFSMHLSKHKAKKEKKFTCEVCGKGFLSNYYMKLHKKVHEKTKKSLACEQCGKRYTSAKSLESHKLFVHAENGEAKGVICEFCGRQFISRASVLNHIQVVHRSEAASDDQKEPVERSQCTMCNASFLNKYRLKKHVDSIHLGKPVKCSLCDKVAPNESALTCHMRSVHVAQSFQCHLCTKTFKAAVALKDHIATHTGEKLYKCSFCPEAFIWRPNMYSHQKRAHPEQWQIEKAKGRKRPSI